jgi:hypothetical protein
LGIAPTGRKAEWTEIGILRIADGRVVESGYDVDTLGLIGQLGVGGSAPATESAANAAPAGASA